MPATKPKVTLRCRICQSLYQVQPYRESKSKCCSKHCLQKYASKFNAAIQAAKRGTGTKAKYIKLNGRHEHRVVAEQGIGRKLRRGEIVHHKDGNGKNNAPENLEITTQPKHIMIHFPEMMQARKQKAGY